MAFNFSESDLFAFFAVLVRFSILVAVLPVTGDRAIPGIVKILLSLSITFALFPALVASGKVSTIEAGVWGSSVSGIVSVIALETLAALILGFTARMLFDAITFGANLVGNFMGFAAASQFDAHQESQTQVVAQLQTTLAMLVFLALDGHHLMLRAALESYNYLGVGKIQINAAFAQRLGDLTAQVFKFGIQIAAPVAVSLFVVNVAFGVLAKAMPQMNVLVLSFAASAFVGMAVMFVSMSEFQAVSGNILGRMGDWLNGMAVVLAGR